MAAEYTVIERPTDAAGSVELPAPGNVIAVSAPVASAATVELDGGAPIPLHVWPGIRSTCRNFERAVIRWGASAGGTLYVLAGVDLDVMQQATE